jgi:hypothetical protein
MWIDPWVAVAIIGLVLIWADKHRRKRQRQEEEERERLRLAAENGHKPSDSSTRHDFWDHEPTDPPDPPRFYD